MPLARVIDCGHPLCSDQSPLVALFQLLCTGRSLQFVSYAHCARGTYTRGEIIGQQVVLVGARASWGWGGTKTGSMCTGSGDRPPSAETDCAPVLSHSPRRASESMHGWAGVCDVSLPENPVVRRLVGSSWLRVAGERNLDLSRMLNYATPGPGSRRRSDLGWLDLLQARGAGGSEFWLWHILGSKRSSGSR